MKDNYAYDFYVLWDYHSDVFCAWRTSDAAFHVYYNEFKASVDIRSCEVMDGNLPGRQTKLVLAWAELHQEELMADWKLVMNGEEPFKIQPEAHCQPVMRSVGLNIIDDFISIMIL